jgi:hypothetical protein
VVAIGSALYYGPVAHHLGLLASARAHWEAAIAHFETSLAATRPAGALAWTARSQVAQARALLARDDAGDRARAARLAGEALATSTRRGLVEIAARAREVEGALWVRKPGRKERRGRPGATGKTTIAE